MQFTTIHSPKSTLLSNVIESQDFLYSYFKLGQKALWIARCLIINIVTVLTCSVF